MSTITYTVQGMTCGGCAKKVASAVQGVVPGAATDVDLPTGTLTVTGEGLDEAAITSAVREAGYAAT
jgi:copper chaperone CopZ